MLIKRRAELGWPKAANKKISLLNELIELEPRVQFICQGTMCQAFMVQPLFANDDVGSNRGSEKGAGAHGGCLEAAQEDRQIPGGPTSMCSAISCPTRGTVVDGEGRK